jgi:putative ABC transport system substrate-binding protein
MSNRREFITLLGGGAAAWPIAARAQQAQPLRRIGVLMGTAASDPEGQARHAAFVQELAQLGWTDGRNARVDTRWVPGDPNLYRSAIPELLALAPDVILASGTSSMGPLHQATRTIPIVFVGIVDPVGGGFVASLSRPAGNSTGFILFEYGISAKWLELLKQVAPGVTRVAVARNPALTSGTGQFAAIQAVAPLFGVELTAADVRDTAEIEHSVSAFARSSNGGLIVTTSQAAQVNRNVIIALAARHRLPAVYPYRFFVAEGGLISYGPDFIHPYARAAGYVDRILKGEKPADMPVQAPTKYELVINLNTAKALGLEIPATLLARADEVIE